MYKDKQNKAIEFSKNVDPIKFELILFSFSIFLMYKSLEQGALW